MKTPKAILGAVLLSSCVQGESVDPSNDMSALSAKEVVDMVADMPSPRICSEIKDRLLYVALKYDPMLIDDTYAVVLGDGETRVSGEDYGRGGDPDNTKRMRLRWGRSGQKDDTIQTTKQGEFTGEISVICIDE